MAAVNRFRGTPRASFDGLIRHITSVHSSATQQDLLTTVGPTLTLQIPNGMLAGDLCVVYCYYRGATQNWSVSNSGGQNWTPCLTHRSTAQMVQAFYCTFNGTWSAAPAFTIGSGTESAIGVLHAFRGPRGVDSRWALDQSPSLGSGAGTAFTITGVTPSWPRTLSIASVASLDDNEYTLTTPGRWSNVGTAFKQYRTTGGTDAAIAFAMLAQEQVAATGNVTFTQATLGADAGITTILVFKEGEDFITGRSPISRAPSRKAPGKGMFIAKRLAITEQQISASVGDLNVSLDAVTLSAAAKLAITGTLSTTLGNVTLASAGALALKGNLSATLGDVTLAATGSSAASGTLAVTLADVTLASNGTLAIVATLSSTLSAATLASAAVLAIKGTASITLGDATLAATGSSALAGNLSATLGAVTLSSTATLPLRASLAVTFGQVVLDAQGVGPGSSVSSGGSGSWRRRRRMSR